LYHAFVYNFSWISLSFTFFSGNPFNYIYTF